MLKPATAYVSALLFSLFGLIYTSHAMAIECYTPSPKLFHDMSAQTYIQHNPFFWNGKQAFIDYFDEMARDYPDKSINFECAFAESDLVALHPHQIWPGNDEYVTMDFFHFNENGKIIEHWDTLKTVSNETKNGNTVY